MLVTIVGSRDFPRLVLVRDFVQKLAAKHPGVTVCSGGADGVDRVAVHAAQMLGLPTRVIPAEWDKLGRAAGMIRNTQLVLAADYVVAFVHGASPGTMNTIRQAEMLGFIHGETLFVYGPGEDSLPPVTDAATPVLA